MAIVQYTGIVNQVRGKLNGSVFNRARNANTLQRKQQAPRRNVGNSSRPRNGFGEIQRSWSQLSTVQRAQWATAAVNNPSRDRFGNLVALAGYNQYIKAGLFARIAGVAPVATPNSSPAPDPEVFTSDITQTDFSIGLDGRVLLEYNAYVDSTFTAGTLYVIIEVGLPVSQGVTTYYGRWVTVASAQLDGLTELDGSLNLSSRYPMPQLNQRVWNRLKIVDVGNGAVVYSLVSSQVPVQ